MNSPWGRAPAPNPQTRFQSSIKFLLELGNSFNQQADKKTSDTFYKLAYKLQKYAYNSAPGEHEAILVLAVNVLCKVITAIIRDKD